MICPVCKADMIIVEYHDIELDFCSKCRGVWFDAGELELLFILEKNKNAGTFIEGIRHKPKAETSEVKRKCPICGTRMDKKDIGGQPKVIIDACVKGHGLWFDGGEVVQLADQMKKTGHITSESDNEAVKFLEEFFITP